MSDTIFRDKSPTCNTEQDKLTSILEHINSEFDLLQDDYIETKAIIDEQNNKLRVALEELNQQITQLKETPNKHPNEQNH